MQTWKLPLWVVIGLCIFCAAPALAYEDEPEGPGRSETPSSYNALVYEVYRFDIGAREMAEDALTHQGYNVTWYGNTSVPDSVTSADPMLLDWRDEQNDGDGTKCFVGHGGTDGKGIEIWCHNDWGLQKCYAMKQYYETYHGFAGELYVAEPSSHSGYSVSIRWGSIPQYCNFANAVIDIETCCSVLSSTYPGARVEFVNDCGLPYSSITTNMNAIWGGFDGQASGTHDDWWYRTAKWGFTLASAKLYMREPITDGGFTTLAPYIKWASFQSNDQVPQQMELEILTDTKVQTSGSVLDAFEITRPGNPPSIEIINAIQNNDTTFTVTVRPANGEFGTSYFKALHSQIVSANNTSAELDGDGEEGPNDRVWRLKHGQDPAADIGAFTVDENGTARIDIECLYQTQKLQIWGLEDDQHTVVATIENPRIGHTELSVGTSYPLYQLVEIETDGRIMDHGIVAPRERVERIKDPHPTPEELRARLDERIERRNASGDGYRSSIPGNRLVIFAAPQFVNAAWYHADYRTWHDGIEVEIIDIADEYGSNPEAIETGIITRVASDPSQLFLLVGDSHNRLWTDQTIWNQNGWDQIKQDYLDAGYPPEGNPERQDIPVGEIPDPAPRNYNLGYFEPNWYRGDGPHYCQSDFPTKVVARLPFHEEWQYLSYIWKIQWYDNGSIDGYPYITLLCVGDVDLYFGDGSGAYALNVAEDVVSVLPTGTNYELLLQSDYMGAWQRIMATVERWNNDLEAVFFASSRSTRYNVGHFLSLSAGFDINLIQFGSWPCWMVGSTCDTGGEFRTMNPDYGETVLIRLLQDADRGIIAAIVPGTGSWQSGNKIIAPFEDLSRPPMESFRQAQCEALAGLDPIDDSDAYNTILSYFMYGDPCLMLRHAAYACDAPETVMPAYRLELRQNSPNPVYGNTTIRFGLAETGLVQIRVYDVGGRLIRTLVDGELTPGSYSVDWRRNTDDGQITSAGVYFCRMAAGGQEFNRKMILLN